MDRRTFSRLALGGLGLAVLPASLGRASTFGGAQLFGAGVSLNERLFSRARAALVGHRGNFVLRDRVALADFSVASRETRLHIVDLVDGQVNSFLVAHGRGSDPEHSGWLQKFSNEPGSLATSAGAYKTGAIYQGEHGASMRLIGLDPENNNAEARAIVVHGADYVSEAHVATWGKLGRSEGCLAVSYADLPEVLGLLGPGRLVYADKV